MQGGLKNQVSGLSAALQGHGQRTSGRGMATVWQPQELPALPTVSLCLVISAQLSSLFPSRSVFIVNWKVGLH